MWLKQAEVNMTDYKYLNSTEFETSRADTVVGVVRTGLAIVGMFALVFATGFLWGYFWGTR
jgi:hypothetical protein